MSNKITFSTMKCLRHLLMLALYFAAIPSHAIETITYYHTDSLGSPVAGTDTSGALLWKEDYKPYGERIRKQVESDKNTRWYTAHPEDKETGLTYAGARFYDSVTGRFLAIDPVGFSKDNLQMFNRYAYANNNPYKYVDPDGGLPILLLIPLAIKAIDAGITAYDTYNAYQEGGASGAAKELGVSAVVSIVPGAKIIKKLGIDSTLKKNKGLGGNPFKNKTAKDIDERFTRKGYRKSGEDPINGEGGYVNPRTGRSSHIDPKEYGTHREPNHVDINRPRGYKGKLKKRKLPYKSN